MPRAQADHKRTRGSVDRFPSGAYRVRVYGCVDAVSGRRHDLVRSFLPGLSCARRGRGRANARPQRGRPRAETRGCRPRLTSCSTATSRCRRQREHTPGAHAVPGEPRPPVHRRARGRRRGSRRPRIPVRRAAPLRNPLPGAGGGRRGGGRKAADRAGVRLQRPTAVRDGRGGLPSADSVRRARGRRSAACTQRPGRAARGSLDGIDHPVRELENRRRGFAVIRSATTPDVTP